MSEITRKTLSRPKLFGYKGEREHYATEFACETEGWTAVVSAYRSWGAKLDTVTVTETATGRILRGDIKSDYDREGVRAVAARLLAGEDEDKIEARRIAAWDAAHPRIPLNEGGIEALIGADRPS